MRKKVIIFSIIVIIVLAIALAFIFKKEKTDRTFNLYEKLRNTQNFTFSMEEQNKDVKYKVSMAQKGTDVCIDMYSDDEHTTTLVLDNQAYFIMHEDEDYYTYEDDDIDSDIVLSGLNSMTKNQYTKGEEEINGKSYYYEEYDNENLDFLMFAEINENSNVKTRFYYEGDNLVYIKNIVIAEDSNQEELLKVTLSNEVDDNLFSIPENYAEIDNEEED